MSKGDSAPSSLVRRRLAHRAITRHALALCYACSQCVLLSCSARSFASMFAAPLNDSFVASLIAAATSPHQRHPHHRFHDNDSIVYEQSAL